MEIGYYKLNDDKEIIKVKDVLEWGNYFENNDRLIRRSTSKDGNILVSTVFLGMPHIGGMFETMVFGIDDDDEYCVRCETYKSSLIQHDETVSKFQKETGKIFQSVGSEP